jgi:hypothetical protein
MIREVIGVCITNQLLKKEHCCISSLASKHEVVTELNTCIYYKHITCIYVCMYTTDMISLYDEKSS